MPLSNSQPRLNPCPTPSLALWPGYASPWRENLLPPRLHPCLPTSSQKPPQGPGWVHEIKHDGYRLIARRDGNRIRLYTHRGYDWTAK
jgi:ATP-dependent DNA ligase